MRYFSAFGYTFKRGMAILKKKQAQQQRIKEMEYQGDFYRF
jgi:hypothetical protein